MVRLYGGARHTMSAAPWPSHGLNLSNWPPQKTYLEQIGLAGFLLSFIARAKVWQQGSGRQKIQLRLSAAPASGTLIQHWAGVGSMSRYQPEGGGGGCWRCGNIRLSTFWPHNIAHDVLAVFAVWIRRCKVDISDSRSVWLEILVNHYIFTYYYSCFTDQCTDYDNTLHRKVEPLNEV